LAEVVFAMLSNSSRGDRSLVGQNAPAAQPHDRRWCVSDIPKAPGQER
jgi:hypothetical protein